MRTIEKISESPIQSSYDAVVTGSGPNGLAAAITLAREGRRVLVVEAHPSPGGGARSAGMTLPGFVHDVCSAIHPMAVCSPFFQSVPLADFGLEWVQPEIPVAHPMDDGTAAVLWRSWQETAADLGADEKPYRRLFASLVKRSGILFRELLAPLRFPPSHPAALASFGLRALPSALDLMRGWFRTEPARALFAGHAAHSVLPLDRPLATGAIASMLMLAGHVAGWPMPRGGAGRIAAAMARYLETLGGQIVCGWRVHSIEELPKAKAYLFDTSPRALAEIAGGRLPESYRRRLLRYRHGPGVFKIDYALSEPVPWTAAVCRRAGALHLGGFMDEVAVSERECWNGRHAERPFVLAAQQSVFDPSRAPEGKHTFWAYAHVPHGSREDRTRAIEDQIERFAPGFRDCVLARHAMNCSDFERINPNLVGGDITGGVADWSQLFTRPVARRKPHTTPARDIFLCSASTPPGGGVHGMCGYHAAQEALAVTA